MTAKECLESDQPREIGEYMNTLAGRDHGGLLAAMLLRAHRCCVRMERYDDPDYLRFLDGRRRYAMDELMRMLGIDSGSIGDVLRVCLPSSDEQVVFHADPEKGWVSGDDNEAIILAHCDRLMEGATHPWKARKHGTA